MNFSKYFFFQVNANILSINFEICIVEPQKSKVYICKIWIAVHDTRKEAKKKKKSLDMKPSQ